MPNSRRKKSGGSSARRDSSTQKESAVAATVAVAPTVSDPPAIDGRVAINGIAKEDTQPLVNGCSTHISNIQNGNLVCNSWSSLAPSVSAIVSISCGLQAASSQTESSDIESLSSDSSRRNTMSSSGGDRTAKGARCKTKEDEQRPVGDTPQSYSITSQVDYARFAIQMFLYCFGSQLVFSSDEGAVRTPEDTYPCCSSSEAVGGGVSEGYTSVSGAASQTESSSGTGDGLLSVLSMSSWDRVDTICELVSFLNIYELRLLGACVEGAARPASSTPTMRQHETRSNCPQFIGTMATEMSQVPYALKVEAAYNVVCLLSSANRQGAHALIRLIDHLMTIRDLELEVLSTDEARREVLINLGKLGGEYTLNILQVFSLTGSSALRILPYFSMDCSPAAVIQYINALSDLPARMMLSSVIYEQFFASRLSSEEVEVGFSQTITSYWITRASFSVV
ncbi:hypothetical protein ANCDUO_06271 [Ancylostoma duodenale]|uniref:RNA-binding protein vts1-like alpha-helical domain-containing protein n=1 Tax=Ancylostoma duodenale TaxID=51022 RepID=A0A0C2D246_9BILA|nr:hypothetical protein ANCDUO_06271 [Ancylostoma duodenale]